jgi:hypothetical protein
MARGFTPTPMIITERSRPVSPNQLGVSSTRRVSTVNAHRFKISGGGSSATEPRQSAVGDLGAAAGGAIGDHFGGSTGREIGEAFGTFVGGLLDRPSKRSGGGTSSQTFAPAGTDPCPGRLIKIGESCVDPMALPLGGAPAVVPTTGTQVGGGGQAVMGAFGIPAMAPRMETRIVRECGPGMVLGRDNLCYPKSVLPKRSKYRKWRGEPKPPISAADMRAIRAAARAQDRVKQLAKDVGLKPHTRKRK